MSSLVVEDKGSHLLVHGAAFEEVLVALLPWIRDDRTHLGRYFASRVTRVINDDDTLSYEIRKSKNV